MPCNVAQDIANCLPSQLRESNHVDQRQFEGLADPPESAESWSTPVRKKVAQSPLVDVSLTRKVAARPAAEDPCSIYDLEVD